MSILDYVPNSFIPILGVEPQLREIFVCAETEEITSLFAIDYHMEPDFDVNIVQESIDLFHIENIIPPNPAFGISGKVED